MIVVISHPEDVHALRVLDCLQRDGQPTLLLDISDLPQQATVTVDYRDCRLQGIEYCVDGVSAVDLARVRSVWWRRPQAPALPAAMDGDVYAFTFNEWQEAINGLWQLINAPWMNPPTKDEVAGRKMLQLRIAAETGLRIPRTLITSDPRAARDFIGSVGLGRAVFKTFSCTHAIWRETRIIGKEEIDKLESVRLAPVIFQEYIPGIADLRVTIVGNQIFTASIYSASTDYPVDFRMSLGQAKMEPTDLPSAVSDRLFLLMRKLGLVYGAVDMRQTLDDDYVFLEINTAGEFLFVEERTGQPITRAVADWLARPASG